MISIVLCSLMVLSDAAIKWSIAESPENHLRRLALQLTTSTNNTAADGCIVGGFDSDHPEKVYVGGPCSLLDVTTDANGDITDATPQAGFRYISMEVMHGGISDSNGQEVELNAVQQTAFYHANEIPEASRVGTGAHLRVSDSQAMMIVGQASILAKQSGTFKNNSFAFSKNSDNTVNEVELCVAACCTPQNSEACTCTDTTGCTDGTAISYSAGQYKFSVFAASIDSSTATGANNWASLVTAHGAMVNGTKQLRGDFFVDQVIDFTGMSADTLTITKPDGTTITYASMEPYGNNSDGTKSGVYEVKSMAVGAAGWSASYTFPGTYNAGSWTDTPSITTEVTNNVRIYAVKLSNDDIVNLNIASSDDAASTKAIYLRYMFDITGVTATATSGKWFAYDPTITSSAGSDSSGLIAHSNCILPSFAILVALTWLLQHN